MIRRVDVGRVRDKKSSVGDGYHHVMTRDGRDDFGYLMRKQ